MAPRVLVCSADPVLSDLLRWNLTHRGFLVRQVGWAPCHQDIAALPVAADVIIADMDCPAPACWHGATRVRKLAPSLPVVFLSHDWATAERLRRWCPSGYVSKPFAVHELLRVLRELLPDAA